MADFVIELSTDDAMTDSLFGGPVSADDLHTVIEAVLSTYGAEVTLCEMTPAE